MCPITANELLNMCVSSESAAASGDVLLYRYVVREIGQTSTSTVDACRVGFVACNLFVIVTLYSLIFQHGLGF